MGSFKENILRDADHTEISFIGKACRCVCAPALLRVTTSANFCVCISPEVMNLKINLSRVRSTWMVLHFQSSGSYLTVFIVSVSH